MNTTGKDTNMWIFNNMLLNNYWIKEEIKRRDKEIRKYKWKWKYDIPKFWDAGEVVLRGMLLIFILIETYLKELWREQMKPKGIRRKEIIKN